ncbi:MAG: hypothetical protein ABIY46_08680 [Gemmatimonadales bacterium]
MTQVSAVATEAARQFWAHDGLEVGTAEELAGAAEQGCARLRAVLTRWIGSEGYRALVDRALAQARVEHPALAGFRIQSGDVEGVTVAVGVHGAAEVREGIQALVARLIDLLSHLIGGDMATRLVEQAWAGGARPAASTVTEGLRDA